MSVTTGLIVFYSRLLTCSNPHVDRCSDPLPWDPLVPLKSLRSSRLFRALSEVWGRRGARRTACSCGASSASLRPAFSSDASTEILPAGSFPGLCFREVPLFRGISPLNRTWSGDFRLSIQWRAASAAGLQARGSYKINV